MKNLNIKRNITKTESKILKTILKIKKQNSNKLFQKFKNNFVTNIDKNWCYYSYNPNMKEIAFVKNKKIVSYYIWEVKELYEDLKNCNDNFNLSLVYNSAKFNSMKKYIWINYLEY